MIFTATHVFSGPERLFGVFFRLAAAWTKNDTDYWTATTWLRRAGEPIGRVLGTVPMRTKSIAAETDIVVWAPTNEVAHLDVVEGDSLVTIVERTGTPAALSYPRIEHDSAAR